MKSGPLIHRRLAAARLPVLLFCLAALLAACTMFAAKPVQPARIAVVLGAGASKGFAHIGVLKVLEAQQVPVHMVVAPAPEASWEACTRRAKTASNCRRLP